MKFLNPIYLRMLKLPDQDKIDYLRQALMAPRHCVMDSTGHLAVKGDPLTFGITDESFTTLVEERAEQLAQLALSQNKALRVFWSGGIASTVCIHALMQHNVLTEVVVPHGLNPQGLWQEHGGVQYVHKIGRSFELMFSDVSKLNITGIGAHNFCLPTACPESMLGEAGSKPWPEALTDKRQVEKLHEVMHSFPMEITNMRELLWAYGVAFLHNHYAYATTFNVAGNQDVFDNTRHFFLTQEFQDYGFSNFKQINSTRSKPLVDYLAVRQIALTTRRQEEFVFGFRNRAVYMDDDFTYKSFDDYRNES